MFLGRPLSLWPCGVHCSTCLAMLYLSNCKFKVRLCNTLSEEFEQEAGVLQGGIISATLSILKISSITNCLAHGIENFLYVDDIVNCFKSKYVHIAQRKLQLVLNKLTKWADCNGFIFSKDVSYISAVKESYILNHDFF